MKNTLSFIIFVMFINLGFGGNVDSLTAKLVAKNFYHNLTKNKTVLKKIETSTYKG